MSTNQASKIVELDDDQYLSEELSDFELDENEFPIKFKQSVLRNKSVFERQLLESTEIDPSEIFEITSTQEVDGEVKELYSKMDQEILEYFVDGEDEENKLLKLATQMMTPLPGIDGVFKKLCKSGEGANPPENSIVTIHYNAYLQDEISNQIKSFDSTFLRGKPKSFMRGLGIVIEGLDLAVGSMKLKEQSEFIISPELAWGDKGCPPRIPANSYVYFKVDMIEWIDSSAAEAYSKLPMNLRKEVSFEKVLEAVKSEKRKGTAYFEKQSHQSALKCYRRALGWMEDRRYADEAEEITGRELCLTLHLDLALVHLKVNRPKKTCTHCKEALAIDPDHPKALYRFGLAQEMLGSYDVAARLFNRAKNILPKDPSIARALISLNEKIQKEKYIETELCRKMLGSSNVSEKQSVEPTEESHKIFRRQLLEFVEKPEEKQLDFRPGMAQHERTFLETEAKRLNLKFSLKSTNTGESICSVCKTFLP